MPMKVAISLPDTLFVAAEELAAQLHVSRSQLYAQALSTYLISQQAAAVTEKLNMVYSAHAGKVDASLMHAQLKSLGDETW